MGGRGANAASFSNREIINTKAYNNLKKDITNELKKYDIYPNFSKAQVNAGSGFSEAVNGKQTSISIDTGLRYGSNFTLNGQEYNSSKNREEAITVQRKVFKILERYNKKYKFDYTVDKKAFRSDNPALSVQEWRNKKR